LKRFKAQAKERSNPKSDPKIDPKSDSLTPDIGTSTPQPIMTAAAPTSRPSSLSSATDATPVLPQMDSPASASIALRWGIRQAMLERARCITCVGRSLAQWPLDDAQLLAECVTWFKLPQRRLVLLAADFNDLPRALPRFTSWRSPWVHAIQAWRPPEELATGLPTLMFDDQRTTVQVVDEESGRGRVSQDRAELLRWSQRIDAVLQRSSPAFALNTLGL
jgi:hypothetical protein